MYFIVVILCSNTTVLHCSILSSVHIPFSVNTDGYLIVFNTHGFTSVKIQHYINIIIIFIVEMVFYKSIFKLSVIYPYKCEIFYRLSIDSYFKCYPLYLIQIIFGLSLYHTDYEYHI